MRRYPSSVGDWTVIIEPTSGWRLVDLRELYRYRDLFLFLTFRSIKVMYAQSALGIGWAVIQPLFSMIVFTVVFGMLAGIQSDGVPYAIFSFTALVPWTYFANALSRGVQQPRQPDANAHEGLFPAAGAARSRRCWPSWSTSRSPW